ncbi:MAG: division/cell wall cluster transcriptional repressor MraZ [Clostridia bacterium]|nr:division/cell wall cluster transcriptional repressor MraZ [Clostridia bacterium]
MFIGEYIHNIDAKGRAIVPAKFREELGDKFIVTQELDSCLALYTMESWNELVSKLNKLPATNRKAMAYKRFKLASAFECEPDGNGRIMIPQKLREYAGITKEIVSTGNGNKVEIWDKAKWEEYNSSYNFDDESLDLLSEFGI